MKKKRSKREVIEVWPSTGTLPECLTLIATMLGLSSILWNPDDGTPFSQVMHWFGDGMSVAKFMGGGMAVITFIHSGYLMIFASTTATIHAHAESLHRLLGSEDDRVAEAGATELAILHDKHIKSSEFVRASIIGDAGGEVVWRQGRDSFLVSAACMLICFLACVPAPDLSWWEGFPFLLVILFRFVVWDLFDSGTTLASASMALMLDKRVDLLTGNLCENDPDE
jgi:hypothetical protein